MYYSNDGGNTWEGPLEADEIETLRSLGVLTSATQFKEAQAEQRSEKVKKGGKPKKQLKVSPLDGVSVAPSGNETAAGAGTAPESAAELPSLHSFSLSHFFSTAFKHHTVGEAEELFCAGTVHGTPMLAQVQDTWPTPWFFLRIMGFSLMLFFGFDWALNHYACSKLIPGWELVGAFGFPICLLVLFFEMNVRKEVSMYRCSYLFLGGGLMALIFALALFEFVKPEHAYIAGFVEEPAKLLAVVMMAGMLRNGHVLAGMLVGAAVGAGFAAFETAGYINDRLFSAMINFGGAHWLESLSLDTSLSQDLRAVFHTLALKANEEGMLNADAGEWVLRIRAIGTIFSGHTQWTAIAAGAYWYVLHLRTKDGLRSAENKDFGFEVFCDGRFWRIAWVPVVVHAFWNSEILAATEESLYIKAGICGLVTWFFVFKLVAAGLRQAKQEKGEINVQ